MNTYGQARADLRSWRRDTRRSFVEQDPLLAALCDAAWSGDAAAALKSRVRAFGRLAARELDDAVAQSELPQNQPLLEPYDGFGSRRRPVRYAASYDEAGRILFGSGMIRDCGQDRPPHRAILALFYLASHCGEMGHASRLAGSAGAVRAIKALGTDDQRTRYLDRLLEPVWPGNFTAGQYLTEVQGGSDVGGNATVASPRPDGSWRLVGEKWFCSNPEADLALVTARVEGGPGGTRGLGLFLLPARLPGGAWNRIHVRRLKQKLGTRAMASGEVDLNGAYAEALGPTETGFQSMMSLVINTSRLWNGFLCAGIAHRAAILAASYARHRRAFGRHIGEIPLVRQRVACALARAESCLAGSWLLAEILEKSERAEADAAELAFFRLALTLNKVYTARLAREVVHDAVGLLGGNGVIETFSALPRLLRDVVVAENWEGTADVLLAQALRDCLTRRPQEGFFALLERRIGADLVRPEAERLAASLKLGEADALRAFAEHAWRIASLVGLAGLADVQDPGVRARAELMASFLDPSPGLPSGALIDRCLHGGAAQELA